MPCYDPSPSAIEQDLKNKVDKLTDLLCQAGKAYIHQRPAPKDVIAWWLEHEKIDREMGKPWV